MTPQLENGYTRIANEIMESLCKIRISGEARQCLDLIIRKTYGFNKKVDRISLSQFVIGTNLPKPTVCKAINKLKFMKLIIQIQTDDGNTYSLNKILSEWQALPKKPTNNSLPKKPTSVTQKANESLPKKPPTIDNIQKTVLKDTIASDFELFWNLYDKKIGKPKALQKWKKLSDRDRHSIMEYLPKYKMSTPEKRYRKNPETFFNNRSWEDEVIGVSGVETTKPTHWAGDMPLYGDSDIEEKMKNKIIKFNNLSKKYERI